MDKDTYQTYEFLPSNNAESESDQFFVVQDDGTFLLTKQIQYVAEEPQNKEIPVNAVPVYDVQSQQYFVNVNNSTELILPDQLILPNGNNSLFTNSYLLQTEGTTPTTTATQSANVTHEYKQTNTEVSIETNNKSTNNCTEITLNDEQYQMLEQKGWILLESNDKIFVLNTLGLHDITTNNKLIHKLKNEIQNNASVQMQSGLAKAEVIPSDTQDLTRKETAVEFVVANDEVSQNEQNLQSVCYVVGDKEDEGPHEGFDYKKSDQSPNATIQDETIEVFREQDSNSIKIKTKFVFPDIPNKIILGKTANGKRIVAKVVKKNKPPTVNEKAVKNKQQYDSDLSETQFLALVHEALRSYSNSFYSEDVAAANAVIFQLLKLPSLRQSIIEQNIILTKIKSTKDQNGKISKNKISLITGKVNLTNDKDECFTHIPNLLHNLLLRKDFSNPNQPDKNDARKDVIENDLTIFHIHVSEVVGEDNVVRVHINLAKRQFTIDSVLDYKLRKAQTTYACGGCATMFSTIEAVKEHQESQCMETEDNLTIDIDILNKNKETYSIIKNGKEKLYSCLQCDAKFARISHCQKHVKTHFVPTSPSKSDSDKGNSEQMDVEKDKEIYKCKMCPATFYHPSTLSRHIVTRHIKIKTN